MPGQAKRHARLHSGKLPTKEARAHKAESNWGGDLRDKCIVHALVHGTPQAAFRKYGVPVSTIRSWLKQIENTTSESMTVNRNFIVHKTYQCLVAALIKIHAKMTGDDGQLVMDDDRLVQSAERLSKIVDNLGEIERKMHITAGAPERRRKQSDDLARFEREQGIALVLGEGGNGDGGSDM